MVLTTTRWYFRVKNYEGNGRKKGTEKPRIYDDTKRKIPNDFFRSQKKIKTRKKALREKKFSFSSEKNTEESNRRRKKTPTLIWQIS